MGAVARGRRAQVAQGANGQRRPFEFWNQLPQSRHSPKLPAIVRISSGLGYAFLSSGGAVVFLVTSRRGYDAYVTLNSGAPLWLSAGVLSSDEISDLRARGCDVTTFSYAFSHADLDVISTIREHHPDEPLWIEA